MPNPKNNYCRSRVTMKTVMADGAKAPSACLALIRNTEHGHSVEARLLNTATGIIVAFIKNIT